MRVVLFIGLALLSSLAFAGTQQQSTQAYTLQQINSLLIGGANTAIGWERNCYDTMRANRAAGFSPRTSINQGGSYAQGTWVSARGVPNTNTLEVPYGTRVINLQLNSVTFLCSSLVTPRGAGADYSFNDGRVLKAANSPNDRAPNRIGSIDSPNNPAFTSGRFRVYSANASDGGAVSLSPGVVLSKSRNETTRYWFASPLSFTYTSPSSSGITSSRTITINVNGREMAQYYNSDHFCTYNTSPRYSSFRYDLCEGRTLQFSVRVNIAAFHDLTPSVTVNRTTVSPGETVGVTAQTQNTGNNASSGTYYAISTMTYPAGSSPAVPTNTAITTNNGVGPVDRARPCQYYTSTGAENCEQEASSPSTTGTASFPTGTRAFQVRNLTAGDYEVGTRLCYALSVYSYNTATGTNQRWRHSAPRCVIVAKSPVVNVTGGDVIVGKGGVSRIVTQSTQRQVGGVARTFGSWGEYGIVASGEIFSMASGAGYSGGVTNLTNCAAQLLTVSNANGGTACSDGTTKGLYNVTGSLPAVGARFTATSAIGNNQARNVTALQSGTVYSATGTLRLQNGAAPMPAGKWVVINAPNATVNIENDIVYSNGPFGSLGEIPQLIIIANNINIASSVTQVDAWLIATGTTGRLNTCTEVSNPTLLRSTNCDRPLVVNGPVAVRELRLHRTAGAEPGAGAGDPAEVFNLRPDAYLWAINYQANSGRVQTVYSQELPPRF